jgi:hypothetical protein
VVQSLVIRAESAKPVLVLLDNDQPGRGAKQALVERFNFQNRRQVMTYAEVFEGNPPDIEAEDLFEPTLMGQFVAEYGDDVHDGTERHPRDGWHYDFNQTAKSILPDWLKDRASESDLQDWRQLLELIFARLGVARIDESIPPTKALESPSTMSRGTMWLATMGEPDEVVNRVRREHPLLGQRQEEILSLLARAGDEGSTTGQLSEIMSYDQPNTYATLQNLVARGFVEKDVSQSPHRYRLAERALLPRGSGAQRMTTLRAKAILYDSTDGNRPR